MQLWSSVAAAALVAGLAACGQPVPPEQAAYVGEWQASSMYLKISQGGQVKYKREQDNSSTSVEAPLKGFDGDNFEVGVGPMSTTFVVSKPPYRDGEQWKMVVDGVELVRRMN